MLNSKDIFYNRCKTLLKILSSVLVFVTVLPSCHSTGNENKSLEFNPVLNKVYHFSVAKYSVKSWTYQSIASKIYDTVFLNFKLRNIHSTDSAVTCKLEWNRFIWIGKSKVNYIRDSIHALSSEVVMTNHGKVKYLDGMQDIIADVEKDSNTGKYLSGVIPDQISNDAIADMLNQIFSVIPERAVNGNNTWVTNITLVTNHPVSISNFNVLKSLDNDTATVEFKSNIFARPSPGADPYIHGSQEGKAYIRYATGVPYLYEARSEAITTTNYYDVKNIQNLILKME